MTTKPITRSGGQTPAPPKPDIDLQSWAALGSKAKPSRTDRRTKSAWKRGRK